MASRAVSGIMVTLISLGMLTLAFDIQQTMASQTVHNIDTGEDFATIQGAIDDSDTLNGHTILVDAGIYYENVVVHKSISLIGEDPSNTVIDAPSIIYPVVAVRFGANNVSIRGLTLQNGLYGVSLASYNNTVTNNIIKNNARGVNVVMSDGNRIGFNVIANNSMGTQAWGVYLERCEQNDVSENIIYGHIIGVTLRYSASNNTITHNTISKNEDFGIFMYGDNNFNIVEGNTISKSFGGIALFFSSNNILFHNNLMSNAFQAVTDSINFWDNGYPSGGNYWSDYSDVDEKNGPDQDLPGSDGIWDHPYEIDADNIDNYPLVQPWTPLPRTIGELEAKIEEFGSEDEIDNQGVVKSLIAKLKVTEKLVDKGKTDEANMVLEDFILQVQELSEIHITIEAADILIQSAEYIISHL